MPRNKEQKSPAFSPPPGVCDITCWEDSRCTVYLEHVTSESAARWQGGRVCAVTLAGRLLARDLDTQTHLHVWMSRCFRMGGQGLMTLW